MKYKIIIGPIIMLSILVIAIIFNFEKGDKTLIDSYNKMQISESGINGYNLDLRIYGTINNESINKTVKIKNYMNSDFEIRLPQKVAFAQTGNINENEVIYIKGNKKYIKNNANDYIISNKKVKYTNPKIYIEGLNNIKSISIPKEEIIANKKFNVYEAVVFNDFIKVMLKDTDIVEIEVIDDINAEIYIDKEGYLYRIIYHINDITINANYYGIDQAREIIISTAE